jgi:prevent-host-death family protein
MDKSWPVQDAKARFSEVLREAEKAPQVITYRGKPKYEVRVIGDMGRKNAKPKTLYDWWASAPKVPEFEPPSRRRDKPRKVF